MPEQESKRYIALIASFAVRNAQYAADSNLRETADDWRNGLGSELYIGIFAGPKEGALEVAAARAGTHPDNIRLVALD